MNFETIVFWVPQTTQVNMEGCCANILKMTPRGGRVFLEVSGRSGGRRELAVRSPNRPGVGNN
jgi:hypothetical protein